MNTNPAGAAKRLITIDPSADAPLWIQIRNKVIFLIRSGDLKKGDRLPTIRDLAVQLDINFNTVSKAYRDLEKDKIISTNRGLGTYVLATADEVGKYSDSPIDALIEELLETAASLGISQNELVFRLKAKSEEKGIR